jgi:hypothetical protein
MRAAVLLCALAFLASATIVELTASHTGPQPYPQFWQGQVADTVVIEIPADITKTFMKGNAVSILVLNDTTAVLWSPSNRTVHVGGQ